MAGLVGPALCPENWHPHRDWLGGEGVAREMRAGQGRLVSAEKLFMKASEFFREGSILGEMNDS